MKQLCNATCALVLALLPGAARAADDTAAEIAACIETVGSYLTMRVDRIDGKDMTSRSLLSLTNGGHAFLADSAEGGVDGYQPFTGGAGAWRCVSADEKEEKLRAVILDFTYATKTQPEAKIARLDIEATYNIGSGTIEGATELRFVPLDGNPLGAALLGEPLRYTFSGLRIAVPE